MTNTHQIERHVQLGAIAGLIQTGILSLSALGAWRAGASPIFYLILAIIVFALTSSLRYYSRAGALGLLILYATSRALFWYLQGFTFDTLHAIQLAIATLFLYVFTLATQATFAHHRLAKRYDSWQREAEADLDPRLFD